MRRSGWILAVLLGAAAPAPARGRNVLVLDTGAPGRPFGTLLAGAFREALTATSSEPPSIFDEALDLDRFSNEEHLALVRHYLGEKYREHPPDAILALGDPATRFVLGWRDAPWPTPPLVFAVVSDATARAARQRDATTGLVLRPDVEGSLNAAFALLPDADEVVLVAGNDVYLPLADEVIERLGDEVQVTRFVDLSLEETLRRVQDLPRGSFIFYTQVTRDREGRALLGRQALEELHAVASRPIFSFVGTYLGHGIVGGSLVDPEVLGREGAELMARVLAGSPAAAIPVVESRATRLLFDARELDRWGLDDSRLPPGAEVRFRAPSLLEQHRGAVTTAAILLIVQAGLIIALSLAVKRRRAAQRQLRRLSGRILTAQEEERGRVARELHDGVGQELALFALELDQYGDRASALAGRARELSRELHGIAYELHPSILDHLGLVPALRQFGEQFGARHGIRVDVNEADWPNDLPADVSLVLYRIAQEALQNVAKHSGAREARVSLRGSAREVMLLVSDQGRGFDPASASGASLGLVGMKERLRLVSGELQIDSSVGGGTVVAAAVPRGGLSVAKAGGDASSETRPEVEKSDGKATSAAR